MVLISFGFILSLSLINAQDSVKNLNQRLFGTYDSMSRPVKHASNITDVCVGLYILQISGVKEKHQVSLSHIPPNDHCIVFALSNDE
jgi:hypothetical protein